MRGKAKILTTIQLRWQCVTVSVGVGLWSGA